MKRICVIGGGIAGLEAVRALQDGLVRRRNVEVLLIDAQERSTCAPLLYEIATGHASARAGSLRLRDFSAEGEGLRTLQAQVTGLDLDTRQILTPRSAIPFDYLILATGTQVDSYGLELIKQGALPLKRQEDAAHIATHIFRAARDTLTEDTDWARALHFVIAGAGQTGVELAAQLVASFRKDLLPRLPDLAQDAFRVTLVESQKSLLPTLRSSLQDYTHQTLHNMGVEILLEESVQAFTPGEVTLQSGETLQAQHLLWAAGVQGAPWLASSGLPTNDAGLVRVGKDLEVLTHERIFAVGDCAVSTEDNTWPMTIARAAAQGMLAAENILMDLVGASHQPFTHFHPGDFVRLGPSDAAVDLGGVLITGPTACAALALYTLSCTPTMARRSSMIGERIGTWFQGGDWQRLPLDPSPSS